MCSTWRSSTILALVSAIGTAIANPAVQNPYRPIHPFAVGFDLSDTYGTASVRLAGGELWPVVRVEGDAPYVELMQRVSWNSSRHMSPPYEWWHDGGALAGVGDIPRQLLRRARKSIGLPASSDVGTLSTMLSALHEQTEQAMTVTSSNQATDVSTSRITFDSIALSSPELPGLYDEDLDDAALHSGLQLLRSPPKGYQDVYDPERNVTWTLSAWNMRQPKHSHALFAAYGLAGHLHHPVTPSADPAIKKHSMLIVYLTQHGLVLEPQIKWTNRTCEPRWGQHLGWSNVSLGWPTSLPEAEWRRGVTRMVENALRWEIYNPYNNGADMNVTDVFFAGEVGDEPALHDTVLGYVRNVSNQLIEPRVWPRLDAEDRRDWVLFGGSLGAAKMAWQLVAEEPLYGDIHECVLEESRRRNAGSFIRYSSEEGSLEGSVNHVEAPGFTKQQDLDLEL